MPRRTPQPPPRRTVAERDAMRKWLDEKDFGYFVTLSLNDPTASWGRMRHTLRFWDAKVNRKLLGKRWRKKTDERTNWIAFPEGQSWHPHWHLLLQLLPGQADLFDPTFTFDDCLRETWREVTIRGSCDVKLVDDQWVNTYVTKRLANPANWENFVSYRDFFEL